MILKAKIVSFSAIFDTKVKYWTFKVTQVVSINYYLNNIKFKPGRPVSNETLVFFLLEHPWRCVPFRQICNFLLLLPQFLPGRNESRYAHFTRPWEKIVGSGISIQGPVWTQRPKNRCIQLTRLYAMAEHANDGFFFQQTEQTFDAL